MDKNTKTELISFAKFWKLQLITVRIYLKVNYPDESLEQWRGRRKRAIKKENNSLNEAQSMLDNIIDKEIEKMRNE